MDESHSVSDSGMPLPPTSEVGGPSPLPGPLAPAPSRGDSTFLEQHIQGLTSGGTGPGAVEVPRSNQEGLRNLMLPGNEEWMRNISERVAAENNGRGPEDLLFDRDGVDSAIGRVTQLLRTVGEAKQDAELMQSIKYRGEEVSSRYAATANGAGVKYLAYLQETEEDLRGLVDDLKVIRDRYVSNEDSTSDNFNRTETDR